MYSVVEQVAKNASKQHLHFTSKKSLNSWWSVNTGGEGRGGPKSGTLSSEKIVSLRRARRGYLPLRGHGIWALKCVRLPT